MLMLLLLKDRALGFKMVVFNNLEVENSYEAYMFFLALYGELYSYLGQSLKMEWISPNFSLLCKRDSESIAHPFLVLL